MSATAPVGLADGIMARVRDTRQEKPKRTVISFPKQFAGLAACFAVALLGMFAAHSGILTADNAATSNCAAPEMAYSLLEDRAAADPADAVPEKSAVSPTAAGGEARAQSGTDADSVAYAACIATGSNVAAQWVENTLNQPWISGAVYALTAEEYAELLSLLEHSGESFELLGGNGTLYQLLAR